MILLVECIILCILFTLLIIPKLYKNPLKCIMSYPYAIRKRVESLPQYRDVISTYKSKHLNTKVLFMVVCVFFMAILAWLSGATTFDKAFKHVFILFLSINIYDLVILDLWLFCHSKRVIIKGTEDMKKEYKDPIHHIKGAVVGTVIGVIIAALASGLIAIFNSLI